jgi:hypothetical protein
LLGVFGSVFHFALHYPQENGSASKDLNSNEPGGAVSPGWSGLPVCGPGEIAGTRHIRARVLVGGIGSALREATFTVPGHASALKITDHVSADPRPACYQCRT